MDMQNEMPLSSRAKMLVFLFFLLSGMSGLIYEVIWTRFLLTVFGATLYAVSTVLAAFMAGLALGSLIGGRVADRSPRPLRLYGIVEILAGIAAVAVPWALRLFDPIYESVYTAENPDFFGLSLLRFGLSFLVLLIPTTCMGATLPLLCRFIVRGDEKLGSRVGLLYATNTAGAVLGVFLAGFVLIAQAGTIGAIGIAAFFSLFVGVGSILLSLRLEKSTGAERPVGPAEAMAASPDEAVPLWLSRLVLVSYGLSGFIALAYQVFWTRALVFRFEYLKNTTYSFSAMLTIFLIGLAAGSAFMSARIDKQKDPIRLYGLIQILIGLGGAFSLFMLLYFVENLRLGEPVAQDGQGFRWLLAVGNVFLRTAATIGLPTFLMGMAFPVAARLCVRHAESVGKGTGKLYALNTVGAIAGSFAAGFLLIPWFGLARGLLILGFCNVAIGAVVLLVNPRGGKGLRLVWSALAVVMLLVFFARLPGSYHFHLLTNNLYQMVFYKEGPLATVAVVEDSVGDRVIHVDNVGVAGTDRILLTDQKSLAHVPMLILPDPKSALTVGFGSGGASWSFLLYNELQEVHCIEIDQTVPEAAPYLRDSNHGVLDAWDGGKLIGRDFHDGRYKIILDDARSYLHFTGRQYDIIATDCTDLRYKSNANLYDVQYFELCRRAITEDGMVVVWMPLGGMSKDVFACAMKTFAEVFPDMTIWYMHNEPTHYLLLLGTKKPLEISIERMLERTARPEIAADLAEVSLHQPAKILSCFLAEAPDFEQDWADAPLNTEFYPYLEFESPKFGYGDEPVLQNLESLRKKRIFVSRSEYLTDQEAYPEFVQSLERFENAVDPVLAGHAYLRRLELKDAARSYLEAKAICPEDASVEFLLKFDTLQRRVQRYPDQPWAVVALGEVYLVQEDFSRAASLLYRGVRLTENFLRQNPTRMMQEVHKRAVIGLATCYIESGNQAKARQVLEPSRDMYQSDEDFAALWQKSLSD